MMLGVQGEFEAFYAVEADAVSIAKFNAYLETLPAETAGKVKLLDCAVGAERCTLQFAMSGAATSKIESAGVDVACIPLDELFTETRVSLIKMDIEGAEYDALRGGADLISREQPVLAICVYHTQSDIWRIPLLLQSLNSTYSFYLRAYDGDGFQSVVYALPSKRLLSDSERAAAPNPRKAVPS